MQTDFQTCNSTFFFPTKKSIFISSIGKYRKCDISKAPNKFNISELWEEFTIIIKSQWVMMIYILNMYEVVIFLSVYALNPSIPSPSLLSLVALQPYRMHTFLLIECISALQNAYLPYRMYTCLRKCIPAKWFIWSIC